MSRGHFIVVSHPTLEDLKEATCTAIREGVVEVTATETFPMDELASRRNDDTPPPPPPRTFHLTLLAYQNFADPPVFQGQDRETQEWVSMGVQKAGGNQVVLVVTENAEETS